MSSKMISGVREMGCPSEAAWLAYLDGEGAPGLRESRARHLEGCRDCRRTVESLSGLSVQIDRALLHETVPASAKGSTRTRRRAYGAMAGAAALVAAVLLAEPPARHVLADALTVFQPVQVRAVPVSAGAVRALMNSLTKNGTVSLDTFGSAHLLGGAASYTTAVSALTARTGLPNRWPLALGAVTATVHPAEKAAFSLNVFRINAWLRSEGATTLFPQTLAGATFTVNIPTTAAMKAGVPGGYDALLEMRVPSMQVPAGVQASQVRAAILGLPFLPQNFRTALSAVGNWRRTAVLPLPGNPVNTTFYGNPAVIEPSPGGKSVSLIWIHQGTVSVFTEFRSTGISVSAFQSDLTRLFS